MKERSKLPKCDHIHNNEVCEVRSKTFQGIADAMAEQWGGHQ